MAMLNGLPQKKIQFTFDEGVRRSFGRVFIGEIKCVIWLAW